MAFSLLVIQAGCNYVLNKCSKNEMNQINQGGIMADDRKSNQSGGGKHAGGQQGGGQQGGGQGGGKQGGGQGGGQQGGGQGGHKGGGGGGKQGNR